MKLEYTLTLADFRAAQRLHFRQTRGRRLRWAFWTIVVPALAALGLIAFLLLDMSRITRYASILFGIECGLLSIAIINPVARYYRMRKAFGVLFPPTRTERTSTLEINEESVLSSIPGVSEGKFFWKALTDFAQDERITLLYITKTRFLFFPTSAMTGLQRDELKALVARHLAKGLPC